jgi:hypothetical protein
VNKIDIKNHIFVANGKRTYYMVWVT